MDSAQLMSIISSTKHLLIATDPLGTVVMFNPAAEEALGHLAQDVVGVHSPALWHAPHEVAQRAAELSEELGRPVQPGFEVFVTKPREEGHETRVWTFLRKDGSSFPAQLTVTCTRGPTGAITGYLGVIEDVSDRLETQRELEEAKAFLDLVFENIPDYLFVKDRESRIIQANPAFVGIYPPSMRDRVIGYTTLEEYDPETAAEFLERDRLAFAQGVSETLEQAVFPDGGARVLNTKKIRFQAHGESFILGISRDVTERESLIARLQASNAELEEFAYRTSHDLRSPLVSSLGLLKVAHEAIDDDDDALLRESLHHVERSLTRLEVLVRDILTLARVKGLDEAPQPIDIEAVAREAFARLQHLDGAERLDVQLAVELPGPVLLKPSRLTLIIENLLSNAIKYQDPAVSAFVRISADVVNGALRLSVRDNGLGIPPEQRGKLFEMFKRFHAHVAFGTGLGLYLIRKSAEALGGRLEFSDPGKGSEFTLTVPGIEFSAPA